MTINGKFNKGVAAGKMPRKLEITNYAFIKRWAAECMPTMWLRCCHLHRKLPQQLTNAFNFQFSIGCRAPSGMPMNCAHSLNISIQHKHTHTKTHLLAYIAMLCYLCSRVMLSFFVFFHYLFVRWWMVYYSKSLCPLSKYICSFAGIVYGKQNWRDESNMRKQELINFRVEHAW